MICYARPELTRRRLLANLTPVVLGIVHIDVQPLGVGGLHVIIASCVLVVVVGLVAVRVSIACVVVFVLVIVLSKMRSNRIRYALWNMTLV